LPGAGTVHHIKPGNSDAFDIFDAGASLGTRVLEVERIQAFGERAVDRCESPATFPGQHQSDDRDGDGAA
jgi:hypothetical protein